MEQMKNLTLLYRLLVLLPQSNFIAAVICVICLPLLSTAMKLGLKVYAPVLFRSPESKISTCGVLRCVLRDRKDNGNILFQRLIDLYRLTPLQSMLQERQKSDDFLLKDLQWKRFLHVRLFKQHPRVGHSNWPGVEEQDVGANTWHFLELFCCSSSTLLQRAKIPLSYSTMLLSWRERFLFGKKCSSSTK